MSADETAITIVLGTRPEIIKLAPVIDACEQSDVGYSVIHTGQHYSDELDTVFFDQLELPTPDHNLAIGSGSHSSQTGAMIGAIEEVLLDESPDVVLVQGDTNSVLAGSVAASKLDCEVGHVEAGLRSFDRSMPEEINRVFADHAADHLFAPTEQAAQYLREEGIPVERITVTGNTIVDAVTCYRDLAAEKSRVLDSHDLSPDEFCLLTAHRAENVDDPERFSSLLRGVAEFAARSGFDVIYPVHPRARDRIDAFDIDVPDEVRLTEAQDFLDFLRLESTARLVFTDSGGVQEEACILGTPCVTLRDNTERPETVAVGANRIVGVEPAEIVAGAREALDTPTDWENPFGDGRSAERILDAVGLGPVVSVEGVTG
ncbi:non-hydrolyzing UDP-N-acetylglucosamine 2-epimerase [Halococcus saccharolyticus]|uniref:UDP-N-acetylglucosamine 2-epimerase n=1 Tax=Halococcus saccharolyticus DSM 5350 TaxID=1227455 RepID=M0MI07_9EURY|nr:UDP-N-acetylglucosamine 2-epimerase (non-hydrolyzing) [Halococcus saccharolyticus]EMA45336.1 UDP-N-acetylglucosamine 2-epimerase [Halococcus saccharolyticus DSM 5350]